MASSQVVEFASSSSSSSSSSSPFGCVLRDHNGRDRYRKNNNSRVSIQHNLKDFVQSCISVSPKDSEKGNADSLAQSSSKKDDKWAKAREIRAVSSLVQKWRNFEAESKNLNLNNNNNNNNNNNAINSSACTSRSNSGSTISENLQFLVVPNKNLEAPEATESVGEKYEAPTMEDESFVDSESGRESNATEKERIRVADIIKKLKCGNGEECNEQSVTNVALPKVRTSIDHVAPEIRGFGAVVTASPRLRGRKAFTYLLMQMERDRNRELESLGERKAVSRFSYRGRLQALLKVRFLFNGKEAKDGGHSIASERRKHSKGSSVMHLRERFNTGVEQNAGGSSPRTEVINPTQDADKSSTSTQLKEVVDQTPKAENDSNSTQLKEVVARTPIVEYPSTTNQLKEEIHPSEVTCPESPCKAGVDVTSNVEPFSTTNSRKVDVNLNSNVEYHSTKSFKEIIHSWEQTQPRRPRRNVVNDTLDNETCSTSDRMKVDINHHDVVTAKQSTSKLQNSETPYKETSFETKCSESENFVDNIKIMDEWKCKNESLDANKQLSVVSLHEWIEDNPISKVSLEEQLNRGKVVETGPDWTSNFSQAPSEWEEDQLSYEQMEESTLDWIYDVSRPRSDWENLRQERYQEMLDPFTNNGDIKQLLERKSVSSFLFGGLRERIDQLMISRTQGQPTRIYNRVKQIEEEKVSRVEVKEEHEENKQEEGGVELYSEVEEEDENTVERQYIEADEYSDETPSMSSASPDIFGTWSRNQNNYVSDDSVASPTLQQYLSFNSRTLENQQFPSFRSHHPSMEMELISDMRGHMEKLHKEIFDLQKSLQSSMEMQVNMQQCMMQQAAVFTAQDRGSASINSIPRKGTCCICHDTEVNSLLYRCGHMCTCFKCAHELQQGSGKCPICQAPILDVVRTYTNYR